LQQNFREQESVLNSLNEETDTLRMKIQQIYDKIKAKCQEQDAPKKSSQNWDKQQGKLVEQKN